jgi:hypothetical protein
MEKDPGKSPAAGSGHTGVVTASGSIPGHALTSAFPQLFRQDLMALHLAQLPFSSGLFVVRTVLSGQMTSAGHGLSESRAVHPGGPPRARFGFTSEAHLDHRSLRR